MIETVRGKEMTSENNARFLEWLDLEADGCLGEADRAELKAAMAVDPELRRVQAELQGLHQALASSRIEVAPGFLERVMAALPSAPWRRSSRQRRQSVRPPRPPST